MAADGPGIDVRCPRCHRHERWSGDARDVLLPGGARRSEHPQVDDFVVARDSLEGRRGPVVAVCDGCAGPLVAPVASRLPAIVWQVPFPEGPTAVEADTDLDRLQQRVEAAWPSGWFVGMRPGLAMFQATMLVAMLVPLAVWVVAVGLVLLFFTHFGSVPRLGP